MHRSFRLTRSDPNAEISNLGLGFPLLQQLVILGFASLILDGGAMLQVFSYAALAHWGCILLILVRRRSHLTPMDRIVIRVGFLVACVISVVLTGLIWHLIGF